MPKTSLFYAYFVLVRKYKDGKCLVHTVTKPFIDRHFLSIKIQLDSLEMLVPNLGGKEKKRCFCRCFGDLFADGMQFCTLQLHVL